VNDPLLTVRRRLFGQRLAGEPFDTPSAAAPEAAATPPSSTGAYLIPMYDETIVAYQDLRVVLAHQPPRGGLLDRAIVIDGRTVGSWKRTLNKRAVLVEATLFGPLAKTEGAALDMAVDRFGRFLGLHASLQTTTAGTH